MFEIPFLLAIMAYVVVDLWADWRARRKVDKLEGALKLLTQVVVVDALNEDIERILERKDK